MSTVPNESCSIEVSIPRYTGRVWFDSRGEVTLVQTKCYGADGVYWRGNWCHGQTKRMSNLAACLIRAAIAKRKEQGRPMQPCLRSNDDCPAGCCS